MTSCGRARVLARGTVATRPSLAAEIVWLDALVTNVDRSARNPNLLLWHDRLWLIDHGAALYLQHRGLIPAEHADRPFPQIAEHVLLPACGIDPRGPRAGWRRGSMSADRARSWRSSPAAGSAPARPAVYVEYLARASAARLRAGGRAC